MISSKLCLRWLTRRCDRWRKKSNVWLKEPSTYARSVPDSSPPKLCSSNTTVNLPSKMRNSPTVVKPSIALIIWRSTKEVVGRLLHTLPNYSYVKRLLMNSLHPRMDSQRLKDWYWRKWKWVIHLLNTLNIERHLK